MIKLEKGENMNNEIKNTLKSLVQKLNDIGRSL